MSSLSRTLSASHSLLTLRLLPFFNSWALRGHFLSLRVWLLQEPCVSDHTVPLLFVCVWLTLVSTRSPMFPHCSICQNYIPLKAEYYFDCIYKGESSKNSWKMCFVEKNIHRQFFFCTDVSSSFNSISHKLCSILIYSCYASFIKDDLGLFE